MTCKYCRNEVDNDYIFCNYCGKKIDVQNGFLEVQGKNNSRAPVLKYEEVVENNGREEGEYKTENNKFENETSEPGRQRIKFRYMLLISACVLAVLVFAVLFLRNKGEGGAIEDLSAATSMTEVIDDLEDDTYESIEITDSTYKNEENINAQNDWKAAYRQIIEGADKEIQYFSLIYVNNDSIPELVMSAGYEAAGNLIYTFYDGELDMIQTNRLYFSYVERENLLNNSDGHMDSYFDIIYRISNTGKWIIAGSGWFGAENNSNVRLNEPGSLAYRFYWNDVEVGEQGYIDAIARFYPMSRAVVSEYNTKDEVLLMIDNDLGSLKRYAIYRDDESIHRYEIVIGDYTWSEAFEEALKRGGYLVHINTPEEYDEISKLIRESENLSYYYWIGAKGTSYNRQYYWYNPDYTFGTEQLEIAPKYEEFWADGEPSYTGTDPNGNDTIENSVYMMYDPDKGRFLWNDAPDQIFDKFGFFKGQMGFIVEYE